MRLPERKLRGVHPVGVLVQQKAQIGCRPVVVEIVSSIGSALVVSHDDGPPALSLLDQFRRPVEDWAGAVPIDASDCSLHVMSLDCPDQSVTQEFASEFPFARY